MIILFLSIIGFQTQVNAGPARTSCNQSVTTLVATPINPPAQYEIHWEDEPSAGVFLVVSPSETTSYRVFLTDLQTQEVFEDWAWVFVHPESADLNGDGENNREDWGIWYASWENPNGHIHADADQNGWVDIRDWFYICNFEDDPPNTPPTLSLNREHVTVVPEENVVISFTATDLEQQPLVRIRNQASKGFAFILDNAIHYQSHATFTGMDQFSVEATDGYLSTPPITVTVDIQSPDRWIDIKTDIFDVHCENCHLSASEGGLDLNTYQSARAGGLNPPGFIPGSPLESQLYLRVVNNDMPRAAPPLSDELKERLRLWILRGALE